MKKQDISPLAEASTKFNLNPVNFQFDLPMLDVILQTKAKIEDLSAQAGLKIMHHFLEQEIAQRCGRHGRRWKRGGWASESRNTSRCDGVGVWGARSFARNCWPRWRSAGASGTTERNCRRAPKNGPRESSRPNSSGGDGRRRSWPSGAKGTNSRCGWRAGCERKRRYRCNGLRGGCAWERGDIWRICCIGKIGRNQNHTRAKAKYDNTFDRPLYLYFMDVGATEVAELARKAADEGHGAWGGWFLWTRINYEQCECAWFGLSTKWKAKDSAWKKFTKKTRRSVIDGRYEMKLHAYAVADQACEEHLDEFKTANGLSQPAGTAGELK